MLPCRTATRTGSPADVNAEAAIRDLPQSAEHTTSEGCTQRAVQRRAIRRGPAVDYRQRDRGCRQRKKRRKSVDPDHARQLRDRQPGHLAVASSSHGKPSQTYCRPSSLATQAGAARSSPHWSKNTNEPAHEDGESTRERATDRRRADRRRRPPAAAQARRTWSSSRRASTACPAKHTAPATRPRKNARRYGRGEGTSRANATRSGVSASHAQAGAPNFGKLSARSTPESSG